MTAPAAQDFKSHRRYDPLWHFVGAIIVAAGFIVALVRAIRHPEDSWNWWFAVYALGILFVVARARAQTLIVQNRLIRLEMRLKLAGLLPAATAGRIGDLTPDQLVGLRFASDSELPGLVDRCLNGQLATGEAVKKEIKNWQPDWLRA
ncbi:MAG TPA: DUF6526 family protein [Gemmatimonadaceae bacterium]|jgi:hypothetical protein|nr:DUF6526 family protein [Gemmatimonadaceae bacterium]